MTILRTSLALLGVALATPVAAHRFHGASPVQAATPTFSPIAGSYGTTQTVTISDVSPSPTMYYTTDGSTPTTSSTMYSSPLSVSATQTVQAIATASGYTQSAVGAALYTIGAGALTWPRLGRYDIGGSPRDYCSATAIQYEAMQDVEIMGIWDGWQNASQCNGATTPWGTAIGLVHTTSVLSPEPIVVAYLNPPVTSSSCTGSDSVWCSAMSANNWWLRSTYPSGTILSAGSGVNLVNMYCSGTPCTGGNTESHGWDMWNYTAHYWADVAYTGGSYGLATGGNSAAPTLDGFYMDNFEISPLAFGGSTANGDYLRNGTTQSAGTTTYWPGWQSGWVTIANDLAALGPTIKMANTGGYYQSFAVTYGPTYAGLLSGGAMENFLGQSNGDEYYYSFPTLITLYSTYMPYPVQSGNMQYSVLPGYFASTTNWTDYFSSTHYQGVWYGMGFTWIIGNATYYPTQGTTTSDPLYDTNVRPWFDYYCVNTSTGAPVAIGSCNATERKWMGAASGTYSVLSSYGTYGIYKRVWAHAECFINPRGNGSQTLSYTDIGTGWSFITGTQRPTWDKGGSVTSSITFADRDAICLYH